jgi:glycosyltransferase involved in cell wall biosynthesis
MYECSFKGVPTGLDAVKQLREEGFHLQLTRVSPLPLSDAERVHTTIDQFHERISPLKMAELYRKADIFLAPSTTSEGFGLPFAEAMASGLPSVASRIPSFLSLAQRQDYAYFVPVGDAEAMAKGIRRILMRRRLRWHLSRRGPQVVRDRFSGETVAKKLEDYFYRMLSGGAWSESINPGSFPGGKGPKR